MWLLPALVGCTPTPETKEATAYVEAVQPVLFENAALARRVLALAADVVDERTTPQKLAVAWSNEIVPVSAHLHDQAALIEPPGPWAVPHEGLVDLWGDRAAAYSALADAVDRGDEAAWQAARDRADTVKVAEERWFTDINERLRVHRLALEPFP